MNVGGRRITNEQLVSVFVDAGHTEVAAYQASGNVILGAVDRADEAELSHLLQTSLGYHVEVFVRTADDLCRIASTSPVRNRVGVAGGKPQVVFLKADDEFDHASAFPAGHEVHHIGTELHWLPPTGLNEIGPMKPVTSGTPGPTTVRTLGTIERLSKRCS